MAAAISIENISKRYPLVRRGHAEGLRHVLENALRNQFGNRSTASKKNEEFRALDQVSCEIADGEVIGLVGPNGAGKSTLLKILSRITRPSSGRVRLSGRVASLLEVGTGFHPELTGRENIFLNGAILGMSREEIRSRFDEIVAFAEVERFLDTAVKHYSSGMYMRLAFAVAAHLQSEILLIDEVLAVGDATFQKKCLARMNELSSGQGRTVFFVSHNMAAVRGLCSRALYLRGGRLILDARPEQCIAAYLQENFSAQDEWAAARTTDHPVQITAVRLRGERLPGSGLDASESFTVELEYEVRQRISNSVVEIWLLAADGTHLMTFGDHDQNPALLEERKPGRYTAEVRVPGNLLNTGAYFLRVNSGIVNQLTYDHVDALRFEIVDSRPDAARQNRRGYVVPFAPWRTISAELSNAPSAKVA
jgi:lipopolysaccharide transport system ATP-binding protein